MEPCYNATVCEMELLEPTVLNRPILNKSRFAWRINYFDIFNPIEGSLCSNTFCSGKNDAFEWRVEVTLATNFFDVRERDFEICIFNTKLGKPSITQYEYCLPSANNKEAYTKTVIRRKTGGVTDTFIAISDLQGYVVESHFMLICEVIAYGEPFQSELENLGRLFESREFSDITLVASKKEIPAHKAILAAQSTVFLKMLRSDMMENKKNRVEIVDVEPEVLEEMLRFVYSGKTTKLNEMAFDLMAAANKYDLNTLKVTCEVAMWENITFDNSVDVFRLADQYQAGNLKKKAINFIVKHFYIVKETKSYKTMVQSHPLLSELLIHMYESRKPDV